MKDCNKELISVIVPTYNAEKYLERCLNSICSQTYRQLEIIVINDGSTDGTSDIAVKWMDKDPRVRIINKENGGVGSARNTGIKHCNGNWILFVDSDDYLSPDLIEELYDGEKGDIIVGGYRVFGANEIQDAVYTERLVSNNNISNILGNYLCDMTFLCPWGKLFKTSIIKSINLSFATDMRIGEDVVFVWTYLTNISSIAFRSTQGYNYYTEASNFKYALDAEVSLQTIRRILDVLNNISEKLGCKTEEAKNHILNYYIWLYKLYIKKEYHIKDVQRIATFFNQEIIYNYFRHNKFASKDKLIVYVLLKMHLPLFLYLMIKLYY